MTYRVRKIPLQWDCIRLKSRLEEDGIDMEVKSLALDIRGDKQVATGSVKDARLNPQTVKDLVIDKEFYGITVLSAPSPEDHKIDIMAISGLGGHAFGSFRCRKEPSHMWLRDDLPEGIVDEKTQRSMARIMTYGYNSRVANSNSHDNLATLANRFNLSLKALADAPTVKPIILIAHSLGGLIVKQVRPSCPRDPREDSVKLYKAVYGIVFFGVPHQGMNVKPLTSMAASRPNRPLIESIAWTNSMNTNELRQSFQLGLGGRGDSEVYCFYELQESPVVEEDGNGGFRMTEDPKKFKLLVSQQSATHYCMHWVPGVDHECSMNKNHSDMVKFERGGIDFESVRVVLRGIAKRALGRPSSMTSTPGRQNLQKSKYRSRASSS
ncbi:hypothetical protein Micbo1qcDRAFT_185729 [Microdochium bolleyi]|uniref:DUF676 domain-containing protein n=1 Tax=Microdochium bolleyi TaxID=196109 RepID=A0A136IQD5_9PEZI|nr:hypothetical protein Micbo1qcDRAFT_185729 [Microdochium bolleyi]